ncbi:shikimate dehydrogenase [Sporolactobacillus kofuensis]|uniref:Shikimate dehydrogenase (NADP(+)) n=1 Tax=Sporolactobacillus kofuensis TaxID=269672 RepID=A0ABW1WD53_9BACL|nr:shikimate dehydrogenase [Sporolactobacillus kofuensis]MCO7175654.1 shikimate dehydrogenase [Sporolactobacillus kofuensis]
MEEKYGLLGEPIEHSLSPAMHNLWFKETVISGHYTAYSVPKPNLARTVDQLRTLGIKGFNVTFPHKTAIIPMLDEVRGTAGSIGAVNTVIQTDGQLIGYNTDGLGFYEGLRAHFPLLVKQQPSVLIIGAGGAARSVALVLAQKFETRVDITNRTFSKAVFLSEACRRFCTSDALTFQQAEEDIGRYQMVINTTSIGLNPSADQHLFRIDGAAPNTLFADLIYQPYRTAFLQEAERKGYPVMNGLPMLVFQGALAFERWTGIHPDGKKMEDYLLHTYLS